MKKHNTKLPDDQVKVKLSICQVCQGVVCASVEHMMTTKSKNDFAKDVLTYNLAVQSVPLLTYRAENRKWCTCNDDTTETNILEKIK